MREQIINLGKTLVKELGLDPRIDTLARWMAHYISEKMVIAESATGDDKIKAEQDCFETILKLWQHRTYLPKGNRPFENFEPIFRTLERLNPENKHSYYFNEPEKTSKIEEITQQWLDVALNIDQIVRIWLDYIFKQAVLCATDDKTIMWLKNSFSLQDNDDTEIILHLLPDNFFNSNEISDESIKQEKNKLINNRIKKLEEFSKFNQKLISILKKELENICIE